LFQKQRSTTKLLLQRSTGGSFQRAHELHNEATSIKRNTDWHHKQTFPTETAGSSANSTLKEKSELHEEDTLLEYKKSELHEEVAVVEHNTESPDNVSIVEGGDESDFKVASFVHKDLCEGSDDVLLSQNKTEESNNEELPPKGCTDSIEQFSEEISKAMDDNESTSSDNLKETFEVEGEENTKAADTKNAGELEMHSETTLISNKPENSSSGNLELPVISTLTLEGEAGESKERFRQRLWCFLFENLNRAVDEIYLLCELECDMEQIDESILVLEEAMSDFRELKYRVEGFDSTKKLPSGIPKDGMPLAVKADHRRPHALSWEVIFKPCN
jgi:S phase cyclin A-associated protein in the endoplasmic reticulum